MPRCWLPTSAQRRGEQVTAAKFVCLSSWCGCCPFVPLTHRTAEECFDIKMTATNLPYPPARLRHIGPGWRHRTLLLGCTDGQTDADAGAGSHALTAPSETAPQHPHENPPILMLMLVDKKFQCPPSTFLPPRTWGSPLPLVQPLERSLPAPLFWFLLG